MDWVNSQETFPDKIENVHVRQYINAGLQAGIPLAKLAQVYDCNDPQTLARVWATYSNV